MKITRTLKQTHGAQCIICTDTIVFHAIGACNHSCCHVCALKLRVLYKSNLCAYCKSEMPSMLLTSSPTQRFQETTFTTLQKYRAFEIYCDSDVSYNALLALLRLNCPECDFSCPMSSLSSLKAHVSQDHSKHFCEVCLKHKLVFSNEQKLYTSNQLERHRIDGNGDPAFKGHPVCGFCTTHFYTNDELFTHCKVKHEQCFLCQADGKAHLYFKNYQQLEEHFRIEHEICTQQECVEKKFVVFRSVMDLRAHELEVHRITQSRRGIQIEMDFTHTPRPEQKSKSKQKKEIEQPATASNNALNAFREANSEQSNTSSSTKKTKKERDLSSIPTQQSSKVSAPQSPVMSSSTRNLNVPSGFGTSLSNGSSRPPGLSQAQPSRSKKEQSIPRVHTEVDILITAYSNGNADTNMLVDSLLQSFISLVITPDEFLEGIMSTLPHKSKQDMHRLWELIAKQQKEIRQNDMLRAWNDLRAKSMSMPRGDIDKLGKKPYQIPVALAKQQTTIESSFKILTINRAHSAQPQKKSKAPRVMAGVDDAFTDPILRNTSPPLSFSDTQMTQQIGGKPKYSKIGPYSTSGLDESARWTEPAPAPALFDFPSLPIAPKLDLSKQYGWTKPVDTFETMILETGGAKKKKGKTVLLKFG